MVSLGESNEDYAEFLQEADGWKDFYLPEVIEKAKKQNETWDNFKSKPDNQWDSSLEDIDVYNEDDNSDLVNSIMNRRTK